MELKMSLALLLLTSGLVTVSGTVCSTSFLFPTVINVNSFSTSYIKTPNYPSDYGTSTRTCYYRVEASTFSRVGYRFASDFEMEYDVGCNNDYVELYDSQYTTSNKIGGSYCGSSEPSPGMTTGNYLSIKLRIDGSFGNYKGFKLGVQASSIPSSSDVPSESSSLDGAGLGIGAIIGISVGSVVFCLCCCCCILICCSNNSGKKGEVRPATPPEPQRQVNIILIADDEPRGAPPPGPAMYPPVYPPPPNPAYPPPNPAYPPPPY